MRINGVAKRAILVRVLLIVATIFVTETFTTAVGDASTGHFSQQQISSYVKTVTSQLSLSKNWNASFSANTSGKLYCNSVVLGEGVRSGNRGLYTWFTCSAMHKLDTSIISKATLSCTGFSSPVWIAPKQGGIIYQAVSSGSEYSVFRTTAPAAIQAVMDDNFKQLSAPQSRVLISRAVQGNSTASPDGVSVSCQ